MNHWIALWISILLINPSWADENPAIEVMQEYLEFAEHGEGVISTEQITSVGSEHFFFVDTRNPDQYEQSHIPNAIHIEWREVLSRRDELPTDKTVVLYCGSGLLSARAQFALSVAGRDNAKILRGGYGEWLSQHGQ